MSDSPRASRLGPHGGYRQKKSAIAGQGDEKGGQGDEDADAALRSRGTNRRYILERLARDGYFDLIEAIEQRQLSCFAAAVAVGYARRRRTKSGEDCNQARRRAYELAKAMIG